MIEINFFIVTGIFTYCLNMFIFHLELYLGGGERGAWRNNIVLYHDMGCFELLSPWG